MLALQTVEGEKPNPTPKRSTFRPSVFFKNLMKKHEEEKALKDKSTVTITADVHREMPRFPPGDRKQKTPGQMIQAAGRFSMQVNDIPVNVEAVPHPLVSSVVSNIVSKVMVEDKGQKDPNKHPFQRQQEEKDKHKDDNNNNDDKTDSDCEVVEISKKDTQCLSNVVSHVKWMAQEYDKFMEEMMGRVKKKSALTLLALNVYLM